MTFDARETSTFQGQPWECYWFQCGPTAWRYTQSDEPVVIAGQTFVPEAISATEIEQNEELRSGSITISLPSNNPVARLFLPFLPVRPVSLVVYRGHRGETEVVPAFTGEISVPNWKLELVELTAVSEQNKVKQRIPALRYQIQCPRKIYSELCSVDRIAFQVLATLHTVDGVTLKSSAFSAKPDGYFNGGWVESGEAAMTIQQHVGDTVTLSFPIAGLPPGSVVLTYPGCQGTEEECETKFNNKVNHLGIRRIPSVNPFGDGGIR